MAAKFAKSLISLTTIANTDAHQSICNHIDNEEGYQIVNIIKAHTKERDVNKTYSQLSILVTMIEEETFQSLIKYSQRG